MPLLPPLVELVPEAADGEQIGFEELLKELELVSFCFEPPRAGSIGVAGGSGASVWTPVETNLGPIRG